MDVCAGSAWGAPVILVPKKDGGWRVVFDHRKLNNVAMKDRYPLPRIDEYLQGLGGAHYFSAMDALDGFHQIPMNPDDIEKQRCRRPSVATSGGLCPWALPTPRLRFSG